MTPGHRATRGGSRAQPFQRQPVSLLILLSSVMLGLSNSHTKGHNHDKAPLHFRHPYKTRGSHSISFPVSMATLFSHYSTNSRDHSVCLFNRQCNISTYVYIKSCRVSARLCYWKTHKTNHHPLGKRQFIVIQCVFSSSRS